MACYRAQWETIRPSKLNCRLANAGTIRRDRGWAGKKTQPRGKKKAIATSLKSFRSKLTKMENERWSDDQIVRAFETKDPAFMTIEFMEGVGAKQELLNATSKELAQPSSFLQEMGNGARVYAA